MVRILGALRGANDNTNVLFCTITENGIHRIGKNVESDICIDLEVVSHQHCVITSRTNQYNVFNVYLTDTSQNGTYVNGSLIGFNKTVLLHTGCIISIVSGHINFLFIQSNDDAVGLAEFTKTFQPGYLNSSHVQNQDKQVAIKTTTKLVGSGVQASIYFAYSTSSPNRQLACKCYNSTHGLSSMINNEIEMLKHSKHASPNVLALVAIHDNDQGKYAYFPFYPGGTLSERLQDNHENDKQMGERDAIFLLQQLLSGLEYLHDKNIIHCDLKAENILISERHLKRPRLIIADFGLSVYKEKPAYWRSDYGTASYHSPEMIRSELFDERVDSWAAGILFYHMLTNRHPFANQKAILEDEPEMNDHCLRNVSPMSKNLILRLLEKNQKERYTVKQANKTRWIFTYWGNDKTAVQDSFVSEREYWFNDQQLPSPPTTTATTATTATTNETCRHPDDDLENVEFIIERRNPCHHDTFVKVEQCVLDACRDEDLIRKLKTYNKPKSQLGSFISNMP